VNLPTKIIFILIPVAVIALLAFLKFRPGAAETPGDPDASPTSTATVVKAVEVRLRPFETQLVFNGSLLPQDRIEVRSELSGRLTALHVHSGRDVEAGEVLAEIDTRELEADLRALTNQLKLAREDARRFEALFSTEGVTERDLDEAVSRRDVLRAQVDRLEALLDKGRIVAPFSGTLGLRRVSEGELLDSSSLITTLQDIDHLYLDFIIPERFMPNIRLGDTVGFRVSGQDRTFNATIQAVDPQVDFETRSITVRASGR
jgi:membrane fusion protein, multidrug efflux system